MIGKPPFQHPWRKLSPAYRADLEMALRFEDWPSQEAALGAAALGETRRQNECDRCEAPAVVEVLSCAPGLLAPRLVADHLVGQEPLWTGCDQCSRGMLFAESRGMRLYPTIIRRYV